MVGKVTPVVSLSVSWCRSRGLHKLLTLATDDGVIVVPAFETADERLANLSAWGALTLRVTCVNCGIGVARELSQSWCTRQRNGPYADATLS